MPYRDDFGRAINYLRVSVTDRCNLRCVYCMPSTGVPHCGHDDILRYEDFVRVIEAAAGLGIHKVRITGGEPLSRLGIADFVAMVSEVPGIDDLSMTTNATMLSRYAEALAESGLHRVNISLDTLRPDRFRKIARRGSIDDVWAGIEAARQVGLEPIKFNVVVIRGLNEDELVDFAQRTRSEGWHVRFIELMPIGANVDWAGDGTVSIAEMRARVEAELGPLEAVHGPKGNGPARYYRVREAKGTLGFIGALSDHFCPTCNRLRLTADGRLRPCLMSDNELDIGLALRQGVSRSGLQDLLRKAIQHKPRCHHLEDAMAPRDRTMAEIGG